MTKGVKQAWTIWINHLEAEAQGEEKLVLVKGSIQESIRTYQKLRSKAVMKNFAPKTLGHSSQQKFLAVVAPVKDRQRKEPLLPFKLKLLKMI